MPVRKTRCRTRKRVQKAGFLSLLNPERFKGPQRPTKVVVVNPPLDQSQSHIPRGALVHIIDGTPKFGMVDSFINGEYIVTLLGGKPKKGIYKPDKVRYYPRFNEGNSALVPGGFIDHVHLRGPNMRGVTTYLTDHGIYPNSSLSYPPVSLPPRPLPPGSLPPRPLPPRPLPPVSLPPGSLPPQVPYTGQKQPNPLPPQVPYLDPDDPTKFYATKTGTYIGKFIERDTIVSNYSYQGYADHLPTGKYKYQGGTFLPKDVQAVPEDKVQQAKLVKKG